MSLMNYNEELNKRIRYIEDVIDNYLPKEDCFQKTIFEAMEYSIMAGGKRIRPMLMLETYSLFGGTDLELIEPFMAAIEMIHTYSLVHDDLPAMDNDEYRRGRKTTHVVYGEAMGILAGDGLLNYSIELVCKLFQKVTNDELPYIAKALSIMTTKSGVHGMIGGQVIDMSDSGDGDDSNSVDRKQREERLVKMYKLKTSALIEASMMIGATMAKASDIEIDKIEEIASNIGLAFQIKDDVLDVTSSTEILGKPVHSDEKNDKVTYVTLKGLEQAVKDVDYYSMKSLTELARLDGENEFLTELIKRLIIREK
jgi:geranylgeranyl diphosphate synthase type II